MFISAFISLDLSAYSSAGNVHEHEHAHINIHVHVYRPGKVCLLDEKL